MVEVRFDKLAQRTFFWNEDSDLSETFNPFLDESVKPTSEDKEMTAGNEKSVTYKPPPQIVIERGGWGNKLDFLFSCISLSVGLGNVWRFPYLCYKNGGGAFLVTYTVAMIFCGIPMFYQEVAIGQFLGSGGMTFIGQLCPILKGVGYATMTIVFLLDIYYCIIIAWTLYYLICTFASVPYLPWKDCDNWWNTKACSNIDNRTYANIISKNHSVLSSYSNKTTTPVEEFFDHRVLGISNGIEEINGMQWQLFTCLVIGWILIYSVIRKGLHQSGKIIWFTATFPYVVLIVLFIRAVTLDGAVEGLLYYVTPRWEELLTPGPWMEGATQIFFAYSIGCGALPALGSYNKFHHNCYKDAVITCIINTVTSLLAGAVTFSILGHLAQAYDTDVGNVVKSGPGLVFLTYPEVVLKLPGAALWAIIFFIMLAILGIDSEFCLVESFITGVVDNWSETLRPHRDHFTAIICGIMFLLGIPMVTHGGMYIFQLMDYYSASGMSLLWVCFFQTIAISWIYGTDKLGDCIEQMMGIRPNKFLTICWKFCAPTVMLVIFISQCMAFQPLTYGTNYVYPYWSNVIGFILSFSSMIWIPVYAVYYAVSGSGTLWENLCNGIRPQVKQRRISIHDKQSGLLISSSLGGLMTPSPSFVEENIE